ncbi:adenylyl-sulfate kinase [Paenibacillus methanolicus]|uniref:Adenylyl-sulfate kinase n=1 Tax=Paenibacillus methanolicus TaxID=582686 RepID=A0A5S5CAU1_9BACL|nr:adenylyl-sulfate kinase [Paenibacillus methanolicus]TYP76464.1 adenylylsulfate kinase [Paenibacillus methanolicus]
MPSESVEEGREAASASHIVRHESSVTKEERARRAGHGGGIAWFTGLPGSGKSTLAGAVERSLFDRGVQVFLLDGDNVRHGLNGDLGFSREDRRENVRRIGETAKLMADAGLIVLVACVSPYREEREKARALVAEGAFVEVYVNCAVAECERRDPKGHYRKAREGVIPDFTGISAPYEPPPAPELAVDTEAESAADATARIVGYLAACGWIAR